MSKVVIVGGGISGLSAGIFAKESGYDCVIIEKNAQIGGECVGWSRKGSYIDGCVHWLTGSDRGALNKLWRHVGVIQNDSDIMRDGYFYVYTHGDEKITVYCDLDKFEADLHRAAPQDEELIKELMGYVRALAKYEVPIDPMGLMSKKRLLKKLNELFMLSGVYRALQKITIDEYAARAKSEVLSGFIRSYMPGDSSMLCFAFVLATVAGGNGNYPAFTSSEFANRMRKRFIDLGGEVIVNKSVVSVTENKSRASAVTLDDGTTQSGDYIIFATDPQVTFKILKKAHNDKYFDRCYGDSATNPILSNLMCAFSVDSTVEIEKEEIFSCSPVMIAGRERGTVWNKLYLNNANKQNGELTLCSMQTQTAADFDYWKNLYVNDRDEYKAEKSRVAADIEARIVERYPSLKGKLTLLDIATPVTYERYVGAYKGSYMAFMITPKSNIAPRSAKVKGLKNVFLASQWIIPPGGLPCALISGRCAIEYVLRADKKSDQLKKMQNELI